MAGRHGPNLPRRYDDELARDREVIAAATPGPWFVHPADDDVAMNARLIVVEGADGELDDAAHNVAVVLLQSPRYACLSDGRWDENAEFIARARERWPALVAQVESLERENAELKRTLVHRRQPGG